MTSFLVNRNIVRVFSLLVMVVVIRLVIGSAIGMVVGGHWLGHFQVQVLRLKF